MLTLLLSLRPLTLESFATVDMSKSYSRSSSFSSDTTGMTNRKSVLLLKLAGDRLFPGLRGSPLKVSLPPLKEKLLAIGFRTKSDAMSIKVLFSCIVMSCRLVKFAGGFAPTTGLVLLDSLKLPRRKSYIGESGGSCEENVAVELSFRSKCSRRCFVEVLLLVSFNEFLFFALLYLV